MAYSHRYRPLEDRVTLWQRSTPPLAAYPAPPRPLVLPNYQSIFGRVSCGTTNKEAIHLDDAVNFLETITNAHNFRLDERLRRRTEFPLERPFFPTFPTAPPA